MKIKLAVLFAQLCIVTLAVYADTITVDYFAIPTVFPDPFTNVVRFYAEIDNLTIQTVFLSALVDEVGTALTPTPTMAGGAVCFPTTGTANFDINQCNAAGELPFPPGGLLYPWEILGAQGTFGLAPGVYTRSLFVYGGFTGANDFSLLGRGTLTFTVTPEPGTLLLFGTGLLGVVGAVRRKLADNIEVASP